MTKGNATEVTPTSYSGKAITHMTRTTVTGFTLIVLFNATAMTLKSALKSML
ncbi:hypothetical protein GCM10011534_44850 [Pseudooceanicola nanhaiensis]|uniref:Uncharacterized protein n=1 Tax=Pseudooceanicola nanhaiensis TaxID=375761 RepID=A0A917WNT0_9RHOB|nr:hypothetical protein [Pseudooceanicola nanhaiensis]GGM17844.1 hypothetical protein GCM10011534_44850 [Pseudooceanicola nanhaiensis]